MHTLETLLTNQNQAFNNAVYFVSNHISSAVGAASGFCETYKVVLQYIRSRLAGGTWRPESRPRGSLPVAVI